jgi:hypothetical protein
MQLHLAEWTSGEDEIVDVNNARRSEGRSPKEVASQCGTETPCSKLPKPLYLSHSGLLDDIDHTHSPCLVSKPSRIPKHSTDRLDPLFSSSNEPSLLTAHGSTPGCWKSPPELHLQATDATNRNSTPDKSHRQMAYKGWGGTVFQSIEELKSLSAHSLSSNLSPYTAQLGSASGRGNASTAFPRLMFPFTTGSLASSCTAACYPCSTNCDCVDTDREVPLSSKVSSGPSKDSFSLAALLSSGDHSSSSDELTSLTPHASDDHIQRPTDLLAAVLQSISICDELSCPEVPYASSLHSVASHCHSMLISEHSLQHRNDARVARLSLGSTESDIEDNWDSELVFSPTISHQCDEIVGELQRRVSND